MNSNSIYLYSNSKNFLFPNSIRHTYSLSTESCPPHGDSLKIIFLPRHALICQSLMINYNQQVEGEIACRAQWGRFYEPSLENHSHSIHQNEDKCPHLTIRQTWKCSLAVCPEEEETDFGKQLAISTISRLSMSCLA